MSKIQLVIDIVHNYFKSFKEVPTVTDKQVIFPKRPFMITHMDLDQESLSEIREFCRSLEEVQRMENLGQ